MIPPFLAVALDASNSSLTLFAPVNSAFAALETLLPGYLAKLMTPPFGLHLTNFLAYHLTPGIVPTSNFPISNLAMLSSGTVNVVGTSGSFSVQSSSPVAAKISPPFNIPATNGLEHLIDNVLVPRFVFENVITALQAMSAAEDGRFSTLLRLLAASGLDKTLATATDITLLAATNAAIPFQTEQFLLRAGNEDILNSTLLYHVIDEVFNYAAQSVPNILLVPTQEGENIVVGLVILANNTISTSYNQGTQQDFFVVRDSIGYVIDTILIPPSLSTVVPREAGIVPSGPIVVTSALGTR